MASRNDIERILAPYLNVEHVITKNISTLSVAFFLYGVYSIIFGLSVHVLSRPNSPASKLYVGLTIALFVLATIYTVLEAWGLSRQATIEFGAASTKNYAPLIKYLTQDLKKTAWDAILSIISTLMNAIADTMLIHRCYVVWNFNKFVLYPLAFVAFVLNSTDLGCIIASIIGHSNSTVSSNASLINKSSSIDEGVLIGILVFQLGLAFMTGGRIWWISRQARHQMGPSTDAQYRAVVAIVIESGILYASSLLAFSIIQTKSATTGVISFGFGVITVLMSGIAPTLIIARVAYYGKSIDNVQQMVSSLHFADAQENQRRFSTARQGSLSLKLPGARSIVGVPVEVDEQLVLSVAGEKMA